MCTVDRPTTARLVLAADAVGCAVAGAAACSWESLVREVDPDLRSRRLLAGALFGTSAALGAGALRQAPRRADLTIAALTNVGWVAACVLALRRPRSRIGTGLIATTAVLDGAAAAAQWILRPQPTGAR